MDPDFLNIAGIFKTNTNLFRRTIDGISPEKALARPGADSNHLLWIAGHVVVHRAKVLKLMGQDWSTPWEGLFARGASLIDPDQFPGLDELLQQWNEISHRLAASFRTVSTATLAEPVSAGVTLDGKVSGKIAFLALHESYHVGQMAYLRKWLGFGQAVG